MKRKKSMFFNIDILIVSWFLWYDF